MSRSLQMDASVPLSRPGASVADLGLKPGDVVAGKYQVVDLIGEGGMGYVLSATHVELGELVALKFLRPEALQYAELVGRFAREAHAAARIKSEHVARVYDVGTSPSGVPYIVMEHLQGQDLASLMADGRPIHVETAVEYIMQACEGLASAHALGIVHRDIKPENLFLTRSAPGAPTVIKLLDFGISKIELTMPQPKGSRAMAQTTTLLGSPRYMSPEQIRNAQQVDARADIWALGCVLYELLTGHPAFNAPSLMELGAAILGDEPVPAGVLVRAIGPDLDSIIMRCLQKRPEARYQNVAELAAALYPFGPRRARMFAERCHSLLQCVNPELQQIHLASIAPPTSTSSVTLEPRQLVSSMPPAPKSKRKALVAVGALLATAALAAAYVSSSGEMPLGPSDTSVAGTPSPQAVSQALGPAAAASGGASNPAAPVVSVADLDAIDEGKKPAEESASDDDEAKSEKSAPRAARRAPVWRPPPPKAAPPVAETRAPAAGVATEPDVGF